MALLPDDLADEWISRIPAWECLGCVSGSCYPRGTEEKPCWHRVSYNAERLKPVARGRYSSVAEMVTDLSDDPVFARRCVAALDQPTRYIELREGEVARTTEAVPSQVYLDWDAGGRLLRVEVIGGIKEL